MADPTTSTEAAPEKGGLGRRKFLTWMMAAPVLTVGARAVTGGSRAAQAQVPRVPQFADFQDLGEQLELANEPTQHMVKLEIGEDSIVRLFLHRMEVGQGITTAMAMLVADELEIPLAQVEVPLRDAAPELVFNQLTGGSASTRHLYVPVRQAAIAAREALIDAAAREHDVSRDDITMEDGELNITGVGVRPLGAFTALAANYELPENRLIPVKSFEEQGPLIGSPTRRLDTLDAITGRRDFTMDIEVPGAKPMILRRPPTIMGSPARIRNESQVRDFPGVIDLVVMPTGVGVVAETFGQAEVARNMLDIEWNAGTIDGQDNGDIFDGLRDNQLPFSVAGLVDADLLDPLIDLDFEFTFPFVGHAPMETNTCIAKLDGDELEIWSGLKIPIVALQDAAELAGVEERNVQVHVIPAGGSFGRRLFHDAMDEAVIAARETGLPIKNMWTRLDDIRHGRGRPPSVHRLRASVAGNDVYSYEHRMSGIALSGEHGLGEALTADVSREANVLIAQDLFATLVKVPYDFGVVTELLNEPNELTMNTGSWRSPYSNVVRSCEEVAIDEIAAAVGDDPLDFRLRMARDDRGRAVMNAVAEAGEWGKSMPDGFAQGIAYHPEYNSYSAWLVEIDARDPSSPRVIKAVGACDVGNPINPSGLEQQMLGCLADGIGVALQLGTHVRDGAILESSYSDFKVTKQADFPRDTQVVVMPASTDEVGGAGELGMAGSTAAVANAYARATGRKVRSFPVNFDIDFDIVPETNPHPTFDS